MEACLRFVVVLGRNSLNNTKTVTFEDTHPLGSEEVRHTLPITESEVSTPPSIVKGAR